MKVIYSRLPFEKKACVATIGVFDGIHLGHQFILRKVKFEAQKKGLASLVITFDLSPQQFLNQNSSRRRKKMFFGYLTDSNQKLTFLKSLGIDYLWILKVDQSFLKLSAEDFIVYICTYFEIKKIIVGEDFRFGCKGRGNTKYLKRLKQKYDFELSVVKKLRKNKSIVSSSVIRWFIRKGNLKAAKNFLGRNFSLRGKVLSGSKLGIKIGFPTANIDTSNHILPPKGVYAAYAIFEKKTYLSVLNIGLRPTVTNSKEKLLEVHLLKFRKNILGKTINVVFLEKIRDERKFSSLKELSEAIKKDIRRITAKYSILPVRITPLIVS